MAGRGGKEKSRERKEHRYVILSCLLPLYFPLLSWLFSLGNTVHMHMWSQCQLVTPMAIQPDGMNLPSAKLVFRVRDRAVEKSRKGNRNGFRTSLATHMPVSPGPLAT